MKKQSLTESQKDVHNHEHQAILDAILKRDAAAREAMINHLHHVSENLFGSAWAR